MTSPLPTASSAASLTRGRRWDHLELLERIDNRHAINTSTSAMSMRHKAAGPTAESMKQLLEQPLAKRQAGGRHGGGSTFTAGVYAHQ